MSPLPKPGAVVFVARVAWITTFYREVASMTLLHEALDHTVLEVEGFQLVIHALRGEVNPSPVGDPVPIRRDTYVKVCLPVASITAARTAAAIHGGAIQARDREWESRGFRACDGHDPEGNVFQVRQDAG
ncbi:MAG: hypothetical protein ABI679_12240 [Gemmatimonadota bacterium]